MRAASQVQSLGQLNCCRRQTSHPGTSYTLYSSWQSETVLLFLQRSLLGSYENTHCSGKPRSDRCRRGSLPAWQHALS